MKYYLRLFILCLAFSSQIYGTTLLEKGRINTNTTTQFISLGGSCHTAIGLRAIGIRKEAFPFDWLISTKHDMFIRILDEDFYNFTDENSFDRSLGVPAFNNLYYGIGFPHDFKLSEIENNRGEQQWAIFKDKYDRRIQRFRELRECPTKVVFFRCLWSQPIEGANGEFAENTKRALELKCALDRYFPALNYTLVIMTYDDLNVPPMAKIPGVVEFRIDRSPQALYGKIVELLRSMR